MLCDASERVMTVVWRIVMSDVVWRGGEGMMTVGNCGWEYWQKV